MGEQPPKLTTFLAALQALSEEHRMSIHHDCSHDAFLVVSDDEPWSATVEWHDEDREYYVRHVRETA